MLHTFARCDTYDLFWKVNGDDAWIGALCNDVFYWATADVEEITPTDFDLLDSCADDLLAIDEGGYLPELFCARKRKMRPQTPWGRTYVANPGRYEGDNLDPRLRALFDACGPPRDPKDEG